MLYLSESYLNSGTFENQIVYNKLSCKVRAQRVCSFGSIVFQKKH